MRRTRLIGILLVVLSGFFTAQLAAQGRGDARSENSPGNDDNALHHLKIKSFSVEIPDDTLTYPGYLLDIPDEHTTVIPPWAWPPSQKPGVDTYLVFASSAITGASGGAVVLETTDLSLFESASNLGYPEQVMAPPLPIDQCYPDPRDDTEFDLNYAGPGSVIQDPTLPPGNLIMIYEAENHCPSGKYQETFYGTVGFARSSDNGRTWPPPATGELGNAFRNPVLRDYDPQPPPQTPSKNMGDAIPSALVDVNDQGEAYLYVTYGYYPGPNPSPIADNPADGLIRVARAKLGDVWQGADEGDRDSGDHQRPNALQFFKWYKGAFSQPGIAGLDSGVLPTTGCSGNQERAEITHNDDLGLYLMVFVCKPSLVLSTTPPEKYAAWYYSTATSLELQDWSEPQLIVNSEHLLISPCNSTGGGVAFDGYYPSLMSPGSPAGHTQLAGRVFFMDGCGSRTIPRTSVFHLLRSFLVFRAFLDLSIYDAARWCY